MLKFEKDRNIFSLKQINDSYSSARHIKEMASLEMTDRTASQPIRDMPSLKATSNSLNKLE